MGKRHTKQNEQQALGQFFTTKAERILEGWEHYVLGQVCIDPFAGEWDLLNWAQKNGAKDLIAFDIEPTNEETTFNDSLLNLPDCSNRFLISNPPYLAANKSKGRGREYFEKWKMNDYYKCHLAALQSQNVERGIMIIPSNFWCESSTVARSLFLSHYRVIEAKYWTEPIFCNATTGITAFVFERKNNGNEEFPLVPLTLLPANKVIKMNLNNKFVLHGGDYLESIQNPKYHFKKITGVEQLINKTNIIFSALDGGRYCSGFHYNSGNTLITKPSIITTYQLYCSDYQFSEQQQLLAVERANKILTEKRNEFDSMFLSNYMGARQKIISARIMNNILSEAFEYQQIHNGMQKFYT